LNPVIGLGAWTVKVIGAFGRMTSFAVQTAVASMRPFRGRRLVEELYRIGVRSLVIILLSGFVVGGVLGLQGYTSLARFGAEDLLGSGVALILIRELGPVVTSLLVTGRAGSSIAAGIASMNATEQLDGLRMMSVNPLGFVVAPNALAMILAMPLLSALFILSGLLGGYTVGSQLLGVDPGRYLTGIETVTTFEDDVAGSLLKALIFGVLVALISTYHGYTADRNAQGVSDATTNTVVIGSVTTLVVNYFFTALWSS
jgi:phospholipid/cholesterol/gamma-HCH transport system permease protein